MKNVATKSSAAASVVALRAVHEALKSDDGARFVALSATDEDGSRAILLVAVDGTTDVVEHFIRNDLNGEPQKLPAPWNKWYSKASAGRSSGEAVSPNKGKVS